MELVSQPGEEVGLSSVRMLGEGRSEGQPHLQKAFVRGTIWPVSLSLTMTTERQVGENSVGSQTTYFFRPGAPEASPLLLRMVAPERAAKLELGGPEGHPSPGDYDWFLTN